jgi:hypothetical protein
MSQKQFAAVHRKSIFAPFFFGRIDACKTRRYGGQKKGSRVLLNAGLPLLTILIFVQYKTNTHFAVVIGFFYMVIFLFAAFLIIAIIFIA